MKDKLYFIDHVTSKGRKMFIPVELRSQGLEGLHAGLQGISSMSSKVCERFLASLRYRYQEKGMMPAM